MEWWETFFADEFFGQELEHIPAEQTLLQTSFLAGILKKRKVKSVLDLCCGIGRLALPLAREGFELYGQDLTASYIAKAKNAAREAGLSIEFEEGDMRSIVFSRTFDAIVDMFSSFGYFSEREEDEKVIETVSAHLHNGGLFVLEIANTLHLIRNFTPCHETQLGDLKVEETREFDLAKQRLESKRKFIHESEVKEHQMSVRLYTPHEIHETLKKYDLRVEASFGDFEGGPLTIDSPRMIYVARKTGADYVDF